MPGVAWGRLGLPGVAWGRQGRPGSPVVAWGRLRLPGVGLRCTLEQRMPVRNCIVVWLQFACKSGKQKRKDLWFFISALLIF